MQKDSGLKYDCPFNLSYPWKVKTIHCSIKNHTVEFRIDYVSNVIKCPMCGVDAKVVDKRIVSWNASELHNCKAKMTACLPVVDCHNPSCQVDNEQTILSNYLLLDLIIRQFKTTGRTHRFGCFPDEVDD